MLEAKMIFAVNLKQVRIERQLSQEALAAAAGLHRTEISLLERGKRDPRLETVSLLARAAGVSVLRLIDGVDEALAGRRRC